MYTFTPDDIRDLRNLLQTFRATRGARVSNTPTGLVVEERRQQARVQRVNEATVDIKISAASGNGQYLGRIFQGTPTSVTGTGPTPPFALKDPGADNCLFINLTEFNALNPAAGNILAPGQWVVGNLRAYSTDSKPLAIATGVCDGNAAFPVLVATDGGAAGSSTTNCSWTYSCTTMAGATIPGATSQTPSLNVRYPKVQYAAPSGSPQNIGLACYTAATPPVFQLLIVYENPTETVCT